MKINLPVMALPKLPSLPKMPTLPGLGRKLVPDEDPVEDKVAEVRTSFMERANAEAKRVELGTDTEYWACVCFETREQKEAFLKALGLLDEADKYIDGRQVAASLGIDVGSKVTWPKVKGLSERLKKHVG